MTSGNNEDGTVTTNIFEILNDEQCNFCSNFIILPRILNHDMLPHFVSVCIYIEKKKNIKLVNHHTDIQFCFRRIGQGWVPMWVISVFYVTQYGKTRYPAFLRSKMSLFFFWQIANLVPTNFSHYALRLQKAKIFGSIILALKPQNFIKFPESHKSRTL